MTLEQIVTDLGYPAILIGTFLEGETIVVIAGFLAHRGYLSLPLVMLFSFMGTVCSDQLFFLLGHYKGQSFLARRPHWQGRVEKVRGLVQRHGTWIILGFRFVYGIRNVTPFVIGSSGYSRLRFLVLNLIGAALWAVAFTTAGYVLGEAIQRVLGRVHQYEHTIVIGLLVVGAMVWIIHRIKTRKARQAARESALSPPQAPSAITLVPPASPPLSIGPPQPVLPRDRVNS